jgi:hypothetical protein
VAAVAFFVLAGAACSGDDGGADSAPPATSTSTAATATSSAGSPSAAQTAAAAPTDDARHTVTPQPSAAGVALVVDADGAAAGVQSRRDAAVGDALSVTVVIDGAPQSGAGAGISGFAFVLQYDRAVLSAPTLADAPSIDANPDLREDALGPGGTGWECVPAPEGDLDDPGGVAGDGNVASGQAFLSCFAPDGSAPGGAVALADVRFVAEAPGETAVRLASATVADADGVEFAGCDSEAPQARCEAATVTVR